MPAKFRAEDITWDKDADSFAEDFGLSREDVIKIIMNPSRSTLDARSSVVGHPIVNHWAGDVRVTVGYRDPSTPHVLHVTVHWDDDRPTGGTHKVTGLSGSSLPRSTRELRKRILNMGYGITPDNHPKVFDRETDEVFYTIPGTPSDVRSIPNTWKAFLRAHAQHQARKRS